MHSKFSSNWLQSYSKATRLVLGIFKIGRTLYGQRPTESAFKDAPPCGGREWNCLKPAGSKSAKCRNLARRQCHLVLPVHCRQETLPTIVRFTLSFLPQNFKLLIHNSIIYSSMFSQCGPGSSVGIAIELGAGQSGIESRWGRDFPHLSRPALWPTQPPLQWVPGLSREESVLGEWS